MHHEVVVATLLEWFTVEVSVDVVINFLTASRVDRVRFGWWDLIDCIANCDESCRQWIGLSGVRKEREQQGWYRY